MKKTLLAFGSLLLLASAGLAQGPPPARDISGRRHPNLARAQQQARAAWASVERAQHANEWDMQGHAQHAKELLDQAANELKMAAEAANRR